MTLKEKEIREIERKFSKEVSNMYKVRLTPYGPEEIKPNPFKGLGTRLRRLAFRKT